MRDELPISGADWKPVSGLLLGTAIGLTLLLMVVHWRSEDGWIPLLDSANLALHEAGHPLVGIFSERLMVYGGTIFQLAFPVAVAFQFSRQREPAGFVAGLIWLGENLWNVGRYMADARAHVLPLVGGGEHDWTEIFLRWGVLAKDLKIASLTSGLGYLLMLGAIFWLWRRYQNQTAEELL